MIFFLARFFQEGYSYSILNYANAFKSKSDEVLPGRIRYCHSRCFSVTSKPERFKNEVSQHAYRKPRFVEPYLPRQLVNHCDDWCVFRYPIDSKWYRVDLVDKYFELRDVVLY